MVQDTQNWYEMIEFPTHDTKNGILTALQAAQTGADHALPFDVQRVLVMCDMKEDDVRGGHTHHKTNQILFAVNGACTVTLDNGVDQTEVRLDAFNKGVWLKPYVWHVMKDYAAGTVLLVVADSMYDEADYIRDFDEFRKIVAT